MAEFIKRRVKQLLPVDALRRTASQVFRPFVREPWAAPTMEFEYGVWRGVSALMSESGRQLGEESARPLSLNRHLEAETTICRYGGHRDGKLMNMSALRIAMKHFDEALAIVGAVRKHFLVASGTKQAELGIQDLYIVSRACVALIAFQIRQDQGGSGGTVSDPLTSQYQFVSGVFMIGRDMIEKGDARMLDNTSMSAEELYTYADENGIFESPNGQVCAGSARKINEFLHFVITGETLAKGSLSSMELGTLVDRVDDWYAYAMATIEFDAFLDLTCARKAPPLDSGQHQTTLDILVDLMATGGGTMDMPDDNLADFERAACDRQNRILGYLQRPAIRDIPSKLIHQRMTGIFS